MRNRQFDNKGRERTAKRIWVSAQLLFACLTGVLTITGCTEDIAPVQTGIGGLQVVVTDELSDNAVTRADYAGFPSTVFETGDEIGVYAYDGSRYVHSNVRFTKQSDGSWNPDSRVDYQSSYTYYAYFPYSSSAYSPSTSGSREDIDTKFEAFISDASDVFWRADQSSTGFTASNLMIAAGTVSGTTVTFRMVHKRGLAVFECEGSASSLTLRSSYGTYRYPYVAGSSTAWLLLKPEDSYSLTDNDGETYHLSVPAGKYEVTKVEGFTYHFDVTQQIGVDHNGGTMNYSVRSYKQSATRTKPVSWTAEFSEDEGNTFSSTAPSWLTGFTAQGSGSEDYMAFSATVAAQDSYLTNSSVTARSILRTTAPVSNYDLSLHDVQGNSCAQTTANCYMVHGPGTYRLPLVYGNAIKNGTDNTAAYVSAASGSTALTRFVNHADAEITNPWLKNNGATPNSAELLWQDVRGLVSSVAISGDYLTFTVPDNTINEGNAVIAVKKDGVTVWSWHIWVTTENFESVTTLHTGSHDYNVTPANVGWTSGQNITFTGHPGRTLQVKLTQAGSGNVCRIYEIQYCETASAIAARQGNCPYYQWGRKDPFVPSDGTGNTCKTVYNITGTNITPSTLSTTSTGMQFEASTTATIGDNIKNPIKHYYNSSNSGSVTTTYYNMWDADNTATNNVTTATKKTIYDPCPPGFCVPTGNLYCYMGNGLSNPTSSTSRSDSNWDSTNKGKTWTLNGASIYFPAVSCRGDSSGALYNVGGDGGYWSATPSSASYGRALSINSFRWLWYGDDRADGFAVRPVAEE